MKKIMSLILSISIIMSSFVFGSSFTVSAANDSYTKSLRDKGFPETYIKYLVPLHDKYPNWEFEAFHTGLDWKEAVKGERTPHNKQLIQMTSDINDKYYCNCPDCYKNGNYVVHEGSTWVAASEMAVAYYMDPRASLDENYIWQFKTNSYNESETILGIETILGRTWMANADITYYDTNGNFQTFYDNGHTVKYSDAIMTAAQKSGTSAYYLASKIVQEVGGKTNSAGGASGTYPGYEGIYNYYNIGANTGAEDGLRWASYGLNSQNLQSTANCNANLRKGPSTSTSKLGRVLKGTVVEVLGEVNGTTDEYIWYHVKATTDDGQYQEGYLRSDLVDLPIDKYNRPWTNPYLSIVNGAKKISEGFSKYQNTGYLQKFNVNKESGNLYNHEYMANVRAASKEARSTYKANLNAGTLNGPNVFYIPVFLNMPCVTSNMQGLNFGHSEAVLKGYPATCTSEGKTDGIICSVCGQILKPQETIPMIPHEYESKLVPPRDGNQGYTLHTCKYCGTSYKDNYIDYVNDKSALYGVYYSVEFIDKTDYDEVSYNNLMNVVNQYEHLIYDEASQQDIDKAISEILSLIYSLDAYFDFSVTSSEGGSFSVDYSTIANQNKNDYCILNSNQITLKAVANDGYKFVGWYETQSNRTFYVDEIYTFKITSNSSFVAKFEKTDAVDLIFTNASGQHIDTVSKTSSEWSNITSITNLLPEVPYSYGNTNGRWVYNEQDVLLKLRTGQNVTIIPQYDKIDVFNPPLPKPNGNVPSIELYNSIDDSNKVGTYIMATGIPEGVKIDSIGLALYYDRPERFDYRDFILTLNNDMKVSKFTGDNLKGTYVVNVNKFTKDYTWCARGYITYYDSNNELQTVYSNQINIVNGVIV